MTNNAVDSSDSDQDTDNEQENISDMDVNTGEGLHPPLTQTNVTQTDTEHKACGNPAPFAGVKLRTGQTLTFVSRNDGIQRTARVLGRVGKATGKHKNLYNLQHLGPDDSEGQKESVDMSCVGSLNIEPEDREADVVITKDISFDAAKQEEIKNWHNNDVFEEVENAGQKCVSTRWVCSLKETPKGIVPKARLAARGFEELNMQELQKDSPTCASESLRLLLSVCWAQVVK